MKKKVFALLLASLLVVSQVGVALSEAEVVSTPAPTLQAIIGALMSEMTEPTAEVTKAPGEEVSGDADEQSTDVKDDDQSDVKDEKSDANDDQSDVNDDQSDVNDEKSGADDEQGSDAGDEGPVPTDFSVSVQIVTVKNVYYVGDTIRIESAITGTCYAPIYQWQVNKGDGEWMDIEGATDWCYEYAIDLNNCSWLYRVVVRDTEAVEE